MILYDYLDGRGINIIRGWTEDLESRDRARLNNKLKLIAQAVDPNQLPGLLFGPNGPSIDYQVEIYKLRIGGSGSGNALRPLACRGPLNKGTEVTLLAGAMERDGDLKPEGIAKTAERHRKDIVADHGRRSPHEHVK